MCIHYSTKDLLASYKVCLCFLLIWIKSVWYGCLIFEGIKFWCISLGVLSMIIYKVLSTWCLGYNICSATFLDIRISTCFVPFFTHRMTIYIHMCVYTYTCAYINDVVLNGICTYLWIFQGYTEKLRITKEME